jgi:hypothetical protein
MMIPERATDVAIDIVKQVLLTINGTTYELAASQAEDIHYQLSSELGL